MVWNHRSAVSFITSSRWWSSAAASAAAVSAVVVPSRTSVWFSLASPFRPEVAFLYLLDSALCPCNAGIRQVDVGQYITTSTVLVSLQQLNPMYVDFPMSSNLLSQFAAGQAVKVVVSSQPDRTYTGKIVAVDSSVDESTRTVNVRATIENKDESLLPGQFADVSVLLPAQKNVVEVPRTAITYSLYGNAVLLVTQKQVDGKTVNIATQTYVTTGDVDGDNVLILKGLKAGDVVVSSGQNKVSSGGIVTINNSTPSSDEATPASDSSKAS